MKIRLILLAYAIISLLGLMILLSEENLIVVAALIMGFVLLGHRELWSLIKHHRMPVIDERVRANLTSSMQLTGIFFFIASILLIVVMNFNILRGVQPGLIISGLLVSVGIVYVIGYYYYDRVHPNLGERAAYWLKICLISAGLSLSTIALSIFLHNFISHIFKFEEALFFIIAIMVAPSVLLISLVGSLVIYIKGICGPAYRGGNQ
jgi:hypothetical protein